MKYCQHCGNQINDDVVICPKCGYSVAPVTVVYDSSNSNQLNWFAILGLFFSIHNPLFGFIFGGIGLSKSRDLNGSGKVLSILAIIYSAILTIAVIGIFIFTSSHAK